MAWVFPGQGAQRRGMGADLFDRFPHLCRQADEILGYSVRDQCLEGAWPGLRDTRYLQPALFVVNALSFLARLADHSPPDYLAGHSLGEYNALFAAGCFDFATGVRLVQRRGALMGQAGAGGMVAVVGLTLEEVVDLLNRHGLTEIDVANHNSAVQTVLSGTREALERAVTAITAAGAGRCVPLQVSVPFHSRHMAAAATAFSSFLEDVPFDDPQIPVIANVTARPYPSGGVRDGLVRQVDGGVRWWESMSYLLHRGVGELVEVGPGTVLTNLWQMAREQPGPIRAEALADGRDGPRRPAPAAVAVAASANGIAPERLGSAEFREAYGLRYAYLVGSMFRGIASTAMVIRLAQAGLMGFFGTGGLALEEVDSAIEIIRAELGSDARFGMNLLATPDDPVAEHQNVDLFLRHDIRYIEAASYTQITPALVHFRFKGAHLGPGGEPVAPRHVLAKASHPEVAAAFMSPPPQRLLARLMAEGALTSEEARAAGALPVAADICVEADSGGHTDARNPYPLMPAISRLRDGLMARHGYGQRIRVGAAGGIGTPEAVAAAFILGADFVLTGSVNQCTPQAGTSDAVKDLLAGLDIHDTAYAPAGDMFGLGARVQVVRKGTLFPARANKLYQVYRQFDALEDIDQATRKTIEERYFQRSFDEVWEETREHLRKKRGCDIERAEQNPKYKMELIFRWYFLHSTQVALAGVPTEKVNYQIHCGPALGAFNHVAAGTPLQAWRNRHVDAIADLLMTGAADLLRGALSGWTGGPLVECR